MTAAEIRRTFIEFFAERGHKVVPSAPVVPRNDPTLLFTNAGMNQFKDIFLGTGKRDYVRAVDSQKCIRVSGKHNDLEEVGPSPFHHTFFEMLGNWSFGDYYKPEAIRWAWELFTDVLKLDKGRLYVTVFTEDDEAHHLWERETDIDPTHISRHGHKDNFWEMGAVGPCGPCSEIHYDLGEPLAGRISPPDDGPNSDSGRFIELWNLVFIQFHRDAEGALHDLPAKHVDTGAGLERIARVIQNVDSNYGTDLFSPIIREIEERSGVPYDEKNGIYIPHRVIADHLRALSFAIADGALPGNEGRGYVLRRILRRAARFADKIGLQGPVLSGLVHVLVEVMGEHFSELKERHEHISHVILAEEESFGRTLQRGVENFEEVSRDMSEGEIIPGEVAFRLYDTFGFPLDLTELMARERGLTVDTKGFEEALRAAREKSRKASKFRADSGNFHTVGKGEHSRFAGYEKLSLRTRIRGYRLVGGNWEDAVTAGKDIQPLLEVLLEKTPFYAESGGQVADKGTISGKGLLLEVVDVRDEGDRRVHVCRAVQLPQKDGAWPETVRAAVDKERRGRILPHHTTTHLLQAALRRVLGTHITQAGSKVTPDYMTFDFTHFEKIPGEKLLEVEALVNRWIREDHPVRSELTTVEKAKKDGAMALFGEKYGDEVRLVKIGKGLLISSELCGGTHLKRTGEAGLFRIESESAVSAGVRRVECTAGEAAYLRDREDRATLERVKDLLGSRGSDPADKLAKLLERQKELEKEAERLRRAALQGAVRFVDDWGDEVFYDGTPILLVSGQYDAAIDRDSLQAVGDKIIEDILKEKRQGVGLIGALIDQTYMFVAVVTEELVKQGVHAGKLVGEFAKKAGGGGGGKAGFATAGSRDPERAAALMRNRDEVRKFVQQHLARLAG